MRASTAAVRQQARQFSCKLEHSGNELESPNCALKQKIPVATAAANPVRGGGAVNAWLLLGKR
jgi:hypothetical protein